MIIIDEVDHELDRLNKINEELRRYIDICNERLDRIKNPPIVESPKSKYHLEDL